MEATMNRATRKRASAGGIVAGIVAGAILSAILVAMTASKGGDVWQVVKAAGTPLLGESARDPGFDLVPVLVGVGVHFGVSILWGLLFATLFFGASKLGTVALGAAWGFVVWLVMYYVALPLAGMGNVPKSVPLGQAVLEHVIFGLALGLAFLPYQRPRRQREPSLADRVGTPR